jgi:hypothetical protein
MSTIKVNKIENTATADGGIAIDASGHVTADGQQLPTAGALSHRRINENGAMNVAQRSTSVTGVTASGYYTVDRYQLAISSLGTYTVTQESDGPDGFSNSFKIDCTTADSSPAAGDVLLFFQAIEAQNLQSLGYGTSGAQAITISYYVKSNKTGNASFGVQQKDNSDKQVSFQYTISSANTWEKKTHTIPGDTSGVINDDNGSGLTLEWFLNSGSNFTGGSHRATWTAEDNTDRNVSNLGIGGSTSDYWQITGVQLEVGEAATSFEHRSFGDELARCQRYYAQSYTYGTTAGTATSVGAIFSTAYAAAAYADAGTAHFPVPMRAIPSVTVYGTSAGTAGKVNADSTEGTGVAFNPGDKSVMLTRSNDSSGVGVNVFMRAHYTASAEL